MFQSIRGRIILAFALPLIGLVVLSAYLLVSNWRSASELASLARLVALAPKMSALVHELQKERGNSGGFLGAKGQGDFVDRLAKQRATTDAACHVDPSPPFWDGLTRFLGPVPSIWSPSWVLRRRGPCRITG